MVDVVLSVLRVKRPDFVTVLLPLVYGFQTCQPNSFASSLNMPATIKVILSYYYIQYFHHLWTPKLVSVWQVLVIAPFVVGIEIGILLSFI